MIFREAQPEDIPQIQAVRNSVRENRLSDPGLVTDADCEEFMFTRGKGWVCEVDENIVAFAIVDLVHSNIWALFVRPEFEQQGIGRKMMDNMLSWYFAHAKESVWLGTAPNTRAEKFYRSSGWVEAGTQGKGEIKFVLTFADWQKRKK